MILALLLACAGPETLTCRAELAPDAPSVAVVTWSTAQPALGRVAFGTDGALDWQTDEVQATTHRHLLRGLPPDAQVGWQATAIVDGEGHTCAGTLDTPPLPTWVAPLSVEGQGPDTGAWLAAVYERGTYASQIIAFDAEGTVRWYHRAEADRFIVDVQPALLGEGLLYDQFDAGLAEDVALVRHLSWDGTVQAETPLPLGHHMFVQLPDGGLAWQQMDVRSWTDPATGEVEDVVGDAIAEVSPDGTVSVLFSVWDWLEVSENAFSGLASIYPQGVDWTHGNALKYDEQGDAYLLSLGNAGVVATVDRATGQVVQSWGAEGIPVADGHPPLEHQHDPTWIEPDTLLVFDSHFDTLRSGAHAYTLVDGALHHTWQHESDLDLFALLLGQAERRQDGSAWVNFGSAGAMEEVDADGGLTWRARLGEGLGFGQARWLDDFPTP